MHYIVCGDNLTQRRSRIQAKALLRRPSNNHTYSYRTIWELNSPLYLLFVDFERAFDIVSREALCTSLNCGGFPEKVVNLIRELYTDDQCTVNYNRNESNS